MTKCNNNTSTIKVTMYYFSAKFGGKKMSLKEDKFDFEMKQTKNLGCVQNQECKNGSLFIWRRTKIRFLNPSKYLSQKNF